MLGHYNNHYDFITDKTVPLTPAKGAKALHLVCFNRMIGETEYVELLRPKGKRPCRHAPQYLLGLMAQVPEDKMPVELHNKDIVAAEPDIAFSVFADWDRRRCFLCVYRGGGLRRLHFAFVAGPWPDRWAVLAEDLVL